jgi:hypothetical protein
VLTILVERLRRPFNMLLASSGDVGLARFLWQEGEFRSPLQAKHRQIPEHARLDQGTGQIDAAALRRNAEQFLVGAVAIGCNDASAPDRFGLGGPGLRVTRAMR